MYLELKDIKKSFGTGENRTQVLKGISCGIEKGKICVLLGPSGSGKSTLLRILGSVDEPDTGSVIIAGKKITGMKDKELSEFRRRNIGYIYQDYRLIPEYTAYENIVLPLILDNKDIDGDEVRELMSSLQIEYCYEKYPYEMSGGEQQRVAIARALINHPAVVYADEPTGNLDAGSSENVAAMLALAASKYRQTIIMVTHDKQMAGYADRVLSIVDGNVSSEVNV